MSVQRLRSAHRHLLLRMFECKDHPQPGFCRERLWWKDRDMTLASPAEELSPFRVWRPLRESPAHHQRGRSRLELSGSVLG